MAWTTTVTVNGNQELIAFKGAGAPSNLDRLIGTFSGKKVVFQTGIVAWSGGEDDGAHPVPKSATLVTKV